MYYSFCKRSELEFCQRIDELVAGFNGVANAPDETAESKTVTLSALFTRMTNLAAAELQNAISNPLYNRQAISRATRVLNIMCDDANEYAPDLVQQEILDKAFLDEGHEWHKLAQDRAANANYLRGMLKDFDQAGALIRKALNPASCP